MEENETLKISGEELKCILAKHYFWVDFQTKQECYDTTHLDVEFENNEIDHRKIKFILKYDKKIDSFEQPIKKEFVITKAEVIDIINEKLLNSGHKINDFESNITYSSSSNNKDVLNFVSLKLKKIGLIKTLKKGLRKNV